MNTFVTHASVRIKGTESNFNPSQCYDHMCPNKTIHMHCPFCVKTDYYQDPVILKAHYRVKHVDKGIDFAGLKILRCCDHCDIVGIIKGEKKFKGAHWHCYKCRNGFNRRDEAIKHYKTHFRNPQTTFQIQIAQEVNNPNSGYEDCNENNSNSFEHGLSIHPALTEAVTCMSTSMAEEHGLIPHTTQTNHLSNGKTSDGTVHVSVAANETVDTSDSQTHHIMIIQEDLTSVDNPYTTQIISNSDLRISEEKVQQAEQILDDKKYQDMEQKYQDLFMSKSAMEEQFKQQIEELKSQIKVLQEDISSYQKREQVLMDQLSVPLDKNIEILLKQFENQHRDLLHQQLLCLKREYKPQTVFTPVESKSSITSKTSLNNDGIETELRSYYDNSEENLQRGSESDNSYQGQDSEDNIPEIHLQETSNTDGIQTVKLKVVSPDQDGNALAEKNSDDILLNSNSDDKLLTDNAFSKVSQENIEMDQNCSQVNIQDTVESQGQNQTAASPYVVCIEYSNVSNNEHILKTEELSQNVDLNALAATSTTLELTEVIEQPQAKRLKQE